MPVQTSACVICGRIVMNHKRPVRSLEQHEFARHLRQETFCGRIFRAARIPCNFRNAQLQIVHHLTHSKEHRVLESDFIVHPDFTKAALAPRRENRLVNIFIRRLANRVFKRSHLDHARACRAFKHFLDEQRTFEPPVSKKFRIVRTKNRDLIAIHVRKQARHSRFAIGDKKSRVVFHKT